MENFYKKVIYDITQLIVNKNYKRAITLGQFLLNKGFKTNELIVTISYAYKLLYGPKQAIEFLQKHSSNQKYNQQGTKSQEIKSPLMQVAYAEYRIENQKRNLALQNIKQLIKITDDLSSNNEENRLFLLLNTLHKNYLPVDKNINDKKHQQEQNANIGKNEAQLLMEQINHLTQAYFQQRDQFMKQNKIQSSEIALKYGHFYIQYNQLKRKILTLLAEHVKKDSLHIVNKRIKRKQNKFLKNTQDNNIKKVQIKQITGKETNQQILIQNHKAAQETNEKSITKTYPREQFIIPMNQIEQLQSLLSHVNGFISFFKSKLKDYGASRVKEFQLENQQTEEQNKT